MKKHLLIFFLIVGGFVSAEATHVLGGSIGWDCLGNDSFKVTLTVYRDCNEAQLSTIDTKVSSSCKTITLSNTVSSGIDITPFCGSSVSRCKDTASTYPYGIEVYTLTSIVDLSSLRSSSCCSVVLSASSCCRSEAITTGARNQNFYIESTFDLCASSCISSPKWKSHPSIINCLGSDVIIEHGILFGTANGVDSTILELTPPMQSATTPTTWTGNHSYDLPVNFLGFPKKDLPLPRGFHVDKTTGTIRFRPFFTGVGIMAVKASIWKGGKKVGTVTRDFHIIVVSCSGNNAPYISGMNCSSPSSKGINFEACPGQEICFKICTSDRDSADSTSLVYNNGISGATFKTLNPGDKYAEGEFCWTPKKSDISNIPRTFTITAKDNNCPVPRTSVQLFEITVSEPQPPLLFQKSKPVDSCGKYQLIVHDTASTDVPDIFWFLQETILIGQGDTIEYTFPDTGKFEVTSVYNGCPEVKLKDTLMVRHSSDIVVEDLTDHTICANQTLSLSPTLSGITGVASFQWSTDSSLVVDSPNAKDINIQFPNESKTYLITLDISDGSACGNSKTVRVVTKKSQHLEIDRGGMYCEDVGKNFTLTNPSNAGIWSGSGVFGNEFRPDSAGVGIHELFYVEEDANSCVTDTAVFDISALPILSISDDFSWCTDNGAIPLKATPSGGSWTGQGINTSNEFDGSGLSKGKYTLSYSYTDARGCSSNKSLVVNVLDYAIGSVSAPDTAASCLYGPEMVLVGKPAGGQWLGSGFISSGEELRIDPSQLSSGEYDIVYTYTDANKCANSDTTKVIIFETPTANFKVLDTLIDQNDTLPIQNLSNDANGSAYLWVVGPPTSKSSLGFEPTIVMDQLGRHDITLYTRDTISGCMDTMIAENAIRVIKFVGMSATHQSSLLIFPNPVSEVLFIENDISGEADVKIISTSGQLVLHQVLKPGETNTNVGHLPSGMYQILVENERTLQKSVFIKK